MLLTHDALTASCFPSLTASASIVIDTARIMTLFHNFNINFKFTRNRRNRGM